MRQDAVGVEPLAVVADLDDDAVAAVEGVERDRALARLAGRLADLGRFDAVVGRVAHHVDQRIAQLVDHPLVQLGLLAADLQADLLAVGPRDVADHALEPGEQRPDGHHPRVHHALLDAVADAIELMDRLEQLAHGVARLAQSLDLAAQRLQVVADPPDLAAERFQLRGEVLAVDAERAAGRPACPARAETLSQRAHGLVAVDHGLEPVADLRELGLVDHQLAGQVHQLIEPVGVDPHGLRGRWAAGRGSRAGAADVRAERSASRRGRG